MQESQYYLEFAAMVLTEVIFWGSLLMAYRFILSRKFSRK